jgi:hypothetical protein
MQKAIAGMRKIFMHFLISREDDEALGLSVSPHH